MRQANQIHLLAVCLIVAVTQHVAYAEDSPPTPVFASNYYVQGVLSLPYAELNEPFTAWYDKNSTKSRTDYYGDLYQVYQFGPKAGFDAANKEFGTLFKLVYVPSDFGSAEKSLLGKLEDKLHMSHKAPESVDGKKEFQLNNNWKTSVKRHCFAANGSVGNTIRPQTVLPNLADFTYDSTGDCPHANFEHRNAKCELWKLTTNVGEKKNTYKFWVKRNHATNQTIPVLYYMLGYDTLLGSHYDRYDITYHRYKVDAAKDNDFLFDAQRYRCGSMPGPGQESTNSEQGRSQMISQNPIHAYIEEPHNYAHVDHEFDQFKKDHEKDYETATHERKGWFNFMHNLRFISAKNRELKGFKLSLNRYADNNLNDLRYLRGRLRSTGYNGGLDYEAHHNLKGSNKISDALPDSWDWNLRGAVTPVKDQAVCGSCWSFGVSGTLEGAYFVKTGKLFSLSQQQMVDCSWKYGNNGCDGGEDFRAYKYLVEHGGISTEEDYGQYLGVDGRCHDKDVEKNVKISGFYNVTRNSVEALKHALVNYGPVTVAIDASRPTFTFYSNGVYYDDKCSNSDDSLDHQVLVVGYTNIDNKLVWIVKNSWSTHWGNNGYILMSAENNNCGVMDTPTVPIIKV